MAAEHLRGGIGLSELARRHDISRELLRSWVKKYEAGGFTSDGPIRPDGRAYGAKFAGLESKVGQLTMEPDLLNKGLIPARRARGASSAVVCGSTTSVSLGSCARGT